MTFLIGMPGGSEWIFIIFFLGLVIAVPIFAITFYIKNKELKKEVDFLRQEKDALLTRLLDK